MREFHIRGRGSNRLVPLVPHLRFTISNIRSGVGAYAGVARRRIHLATVFLRAPSGHRQGRRQARQARILQIGLRLVIAQADARLVMPLSFT